MSAKRMTPRQERATALRKLRAARANGAPFTMREDKWHLSLCELAALGKVKATLVDGKFFWFET